MFFLEYYWTMLILVPGIIFAAYAQHQVSSAYKTYSRVPTKNGMTGADAARLLLNANGLNSIHIENVAGNLTDHYDPRHKIMRLSSGVGQQASVAAVGIAAHETGHAIQDKEGYWPLRFRGFYCAHHWFCLKFSLATFFYRAFIWTNLWLGSDVYESGNHSLFI
jgi:Predicted Zn-dependent protease